ncbi:MAG: LptF/LptG family permease [Planctomycetaceae bacterium]
MTLLQRHITAELLRVFLLLIVILTVMLVFVGALNEGQDKIGPKQIIQIMPFIVPSMLPFTIPATLLLAVTVVYGRMAGDLEITAAKAAGINPLQLLMPAFVLGAILAVGSFGLTNFAVPWAVGKIEQIVSQAIEDIFLDRLTSQHFISEPEHGFSITVEGVRNGILLGPTFKYRNGEHEQVTLHARFASIRFDLPNRTVKIRVKDAHASVPGRDAGGRMDEKELSFPFNLDDTTGKRSFRHQQIAEIKEAIAEWQHGKSRNRFQRDQEAAMLMLTGDFSGLAEPRIQEYADYSRAADYHCRKLKTEIHSRYAMAGSCLFFALVGGPFAVYQARRQFMTAFIMCFLPILLVYYPVTFLMTNLGKTGAVDPVWGMWIPNVILTLAAAVVLKKVIQH